MTRPMNNDSSSLDDLSMFQDGESETYAQNTDEGFDPAGNDGDWDDSHLEANGATATEPDTYRDRSSRRQRRTTQATAAPGGGLGTALGLIFLLLGAASTALTFVETPAVATVLEMFSKVGVSPALLLISGAILLTIGRTTKSLGQASSATDQSERIETNLDFLVENLPASSAETSSEAEEDRKHILLALQRQDEKITNLTRATKMYGKPLVEISTQVNDLDTKLADLATQVTSLSNKPSTESPLAEQLSETVDATTRAQKAIESLTQNVESLATSQEVLTGLEKLVTNDDLMAGLEMIASKAPAAASNEELEQTLSSIQREIQSLATTVATIKSAPAAAAPAAQTDAVTASPQTAAPTPQDLEHNDGKKPPAGLAQSIAGKRKTGSKNVLGAIAKLKGMRN